ncbi:hypothetical protein Plec18167_001976 [Paecilomyces lecythidis]|uniref:BZIP domain-containing protein n=1 Tax=Paecilomyces lecythidis TaxID=3004212 RepID=A0ABR3YCY5_9EURO
MATWDSVLGTMNIVNPFEVEMMGLDPPSSFQRLPSSYTSPVSRSSSSVPNPDVVAILSATSYPAFERTSNAQWNYGFEPPFRKEDASRAVEDGMQLDPSPEIGNLNNSYSAKKPRRKRGQNTESPIEAGPTSRKRRGRARKVNESESQAERRRGQIRRAQRAYRMRQEATALSLRSQVGRLQSIVDKMNQTFLSFGDDLAESGILRLNPDLRIKLREVTAEFEMLAKGDCESNEESVRSMNSATSDRNTICLSESESPEPCHADIDAYGHIPGDIDETPATFIETTDSAENVPTKDSDPTCGRQQIDIPDVERRLSLMTYSMAFRDSTLPDPCPAEACFSERLKYACAQRGYRFLKDPSVENSRLLRSFRFLMTKMTRDHITGYFRMFLESSGAPEVLQLLNIPKVNLGGAGTHYPRRLPANKRDSARDIAPGQIITVMDSPSLAEDYRGEWFNEEDVEGFLEEHGILTGRRNSDFISQDSCLPRLIVDERQLIECEILIAPEYFYFRDPN